MRAAFGGSKPKKGEEVVDLETEVFKEIDQYLRENGRPPPTMSLPELMALAQLSHVHLHFEGGGEQTIQLNSTMFGLPVATGGTVIIYSMACTRWQTTAEVGLEISIGNDPCYSDRLRKTPYHSSKGGVGKAYNDVFVPGFQMGSNTFYLHYRGRPISPLKEAYEDFTPESVSRGIIRQFVDGQEMMLVPITTDFGKALTFMYAHYQFEVMENGRQRCYCMPAKDDPANPERKGGDTLLGWVKRDVANPLVPVEPRNIVIKAHPLAAAGQNWSLSLRMSIMFISTSMQHELMAAAAQ